MKPVLGTSDQQTPSPSLSPVTLDVNHLEDHADLLDESAQVARTGMTHTEAVQEAARHMGLFRLWARQAIDKGRLGNAAFDDAVQEQYVEAVRCLKDYDPRRGAVSTYLKNFVRQNGIKRARTVSDGRDARRARRASGERVELDSVLASFEECASGPDPVDSVSYPPRLIPNREEDATLLNRKALLWDAIEKLSAKQREAIEFELSGLTPADTARKLGITSTAVTARLRSAKQRLRQLVGQAPVTTRTRATPPASVVGRVGASEPLRECAA